MVNDTGWWPTALKNIMRKNGKCMGLVIVQWWLLDGSERLMDWRVEEYSRDGLNPPTSPVRIIMSSGFKLTRNGYELAIECQAVKLWSTAAWWMGSTIQSGAPPGYASSLTGYPSPRPSREADPCSWVQLRWRTRICDWMQLTTRPSATWTCRSCSHC